MSPISLDSRSGLGSDIDRRSCRPVRIPGEDSSLHGEWVGLRSIRVVWGKWGPCERISAPELGITVDGSSFDEAWERFLLQVGDRRDSAWLTFNVGRTTKDEIAAGLNALEDEEWSEPLDPTES